MKLSAALEYEKLREDAASWNKVILHRDGKFYHAYDWSAWLIKQYVCTEEFQQQRGDAKMLSAMRYPTKDSEYVITGFPLDSIGKYIPEYISMTPVEDGGGDVIIEVALPEGADAMTYDEIRQGFEQWREECPVKEQKPKAGKGAPSNAPEGCGMPIGNLTSQLFSNVYMNPFDQMVKRILRFLFYGRYVDDSDTICADRQRLENAIPVMRDFLKDELCLDIHMGKTQIIDVRYGVEFLGAFIKPHRTYLANHTLDGIRHEVVAVKHMGRDQAYRTVNSLLGVMSHYACYNIRRELFMQPHIFRIGMPDEDLTMIGKPTTGICS